MATSNFERMNYDLPLMVGGLSGDYEVDEMDYEIARDMVEDMNNDLDYYEIIIKAGYYEGFQFQVDETMWYYEDEEEEKMAADELEKIREWMENLKEDGFIELAVSAHFSNGETWYTKVA